MFHYEYIPYWTLAKKLYQAHMSLRSIEVFFKLCVEVAITYDPYFQLKDPQSLPTVPLWSSVCRARPLTLTVEVAEDTSSVMTKLSPVMASSDSSRMPPVCHHGVITSEGERV